ncbi:YfjI family protein [Paenibacillus sabinae]|uniref:DnaB domain-containing protein helicase domain-containing protein n=1 Tax=Paenibacillus sabinae T27 TaxID=1268072 RepID=X4ZY08_9BACL|nr:YfjI family protein [Paenibacillus sabinae]AHV97083.1 DnaB domain-containing protein helicase domain-containing protein [Paenibacillus sabinae T27]
MIIKQSDMEQTGIVPFDQYELPSFPVDIFPNWLGQFVLSVSDASQTPTDASGFAALSVLSTALSKKFLIRPFTRGSWTELNNLYTVVIMPSGERKSVVHNAFVWPVIEYEKRKRKEALQDKDSDSDEDGSMPRFIADDTTPEKLIGLMKKNNERMAVLSSEGGLFEMLDGKRYTTTPNLDVYLKSYTGDYLAVDRMGRPSEVLNNPILTIGLFVQPSVLQGLPDRLADRGLFGRFLYAKPRSMRGKRDVTPKEIDEHAAQKFYASITAMMEFNPKYPIQLSLSEEAQELFLAFLKEQEESLNNDLAFDFMTSWTERLPAHLLRIASLLHAAEQFELGEDVLGDINRIISLDTIERVLGTIQYFVDHALAAFGCIKSDEELESAKYLWNVLVREGKQDYRKQYIWQKTKGKFARVERLDTAISILRQRSYLDIETDCSKPGRKALLIRLNPKAIELFDPYRSKRASVNQAERISLPKEIVKG